MTKSDIQTINRLIEEVNSIPDVLLSETDLTTLRELSSAAPEHQAVAAQVKNRIRNAKNLKSKTEAIFRAIVGETSSYIGDIQRIAIEQSSENSTYDIVNATWKEAKSTLLEILEKSKVEFEETLIRENSRNSIKSFFRSNQARGIILTALLSLGVGFLSKDFVYDLYGKVSWTTLGSAFPNFEVLELQRTVDLQEWTPTLTDNEDELSGKATYDDQYIIRKIRDEGKEFCVTAGSSGSEPQFTSQTHQIRQTPIEIKLEGWPNLKKQVLAVLDVKDERSNSTFTAKIRSVRYRGFSDAKANWCSGGIWHPTKKLIYRVNFPKGKMGNSFSFSTSFFYDRNNLQKISFDSSHMKIDSTSVTWTVDYPTIGNAYKIEWNW